MKKTTQITSCQLPAICLILGMLMASGKVSAVECEWSPLTRIESTICADPALRALDRELTATIARASDVLGQTQARRIRNGIARQCRRDTDVTLASCLLNAELGALEQIAIQLGEFQVNQLDHRSSKQKPVEKLRVLRRQLTLAQSSLRVTGDPHLTVTTIVELISLGKQRRSHANADEINRLQRQLAQGCQHPVYAAQWQASVVKNGLQCVSPQTRIYSFSDFD